MPRRYEVDPQGPFIMSADDMYAFPPFAITAAELSAGVTPTNYAYASYPWIDVRRYGAVGDGSTDCTTAIANAIAVASATSYRASVYFPRGQYEHTGITVSTQGVGMIGDGRRESVLHYSSGSGDGISIASGANNFHMQDLQIHGNSSAASNLRISAAANWAMDRVHFSANGQTADCVIIEKASFYGCASDCMIDGGGTAARGMLLQANGAASGPNSSSFYDIRVQQCTTAADLTDGNNLLFIAPRMENSITTGFDIRANIRDVTIIGPRFDWNVAASKGVNIRAGAARVHIINPRNDVAGAGSTLLSDSGTDTYMVEGDHITGQPQFKTSLEVADGVADNPFIMWSTSAGTQKGLVQITGSIFDFFAATGFSQRFRTAGGSFTPLQLDTLGSAIAGTGTLATTATDGFLYVPSGAGVPTGVPTTKSGYCPVYVDTTNNRWYFYSGGAWRNAGP